MASLARPGSNVTGVTANNPELSAKRVGLLKEVAPAAVRMTVLANPDFQPTRSKLAETRHAAQSLGVDLRVLEARAPADLARSFDAMARAGAQGVIVLADPMFIAQRRQIAELALRGRLPSMYHLRQFAEAGGLLSYGADYRDLFQQSAVLIDKILKGAKPADLPVEQPWRYALVVNLKTASALGLTVPQSVLIQADDVLR